MKFLLGILIGLLGTTALVILDVKLVKYILTFVPQNDWAGLISVIIILVDIFLTAGICIIPFVVGFSIGAFLETR